MAAEVTAADIARLAGVGRAAVSNWRRRHADFPRPVGGSPASPTFSVDEVESWLEANGRRPDSTGRARLRQPAAMDRLAEIVAGLLPSRAPGTILDPACGTGGMLAAAATRFGSQSTYVGQDEDRSNVAAAEKSLADVGVSTSKLVTGSPLGEDALARYRGAADVVVCLPPTKAPWLSEEAGLDLPWEFGPPSSLDPALAWLQVCYAYLKPDGVAVMPMPAAMASKGSARRVRAELLRAGALRQVVALPDQLGVQTSGPWQIWILQRPAGRPRYAVRMVDLSGMPSEEIPTDETGWRSVYRDPSRCCDVEAIELLDEDVLLLPARHVEVPVRDVGPEYDRLRTALTDADAQIDVKLPTFGRTTGIAPNAALSVADLIRLGAITFVEKGAEVLPGDVVVPTGPGRFDASVVGEDGKHASGEVLRCDPDVVDPYFLACFLRSEVNRRTASGTIGGTPRIDLRRARIPRLPLSDQRQYGEAFRLLTSVTNRIDAMSRLANEAVQTAIYGLTTGVFAPEKADAPPASRATRRRGVVRK